MVVTGSHCGAINFWRQSAQVIEPLVVGGGVRRSAPRALKSMFTIFAGGSGQDAVSSLQFLSLPNKMRICVVLDWKVSLLSCGVWKDLKMRTKKQDMMLCIQMMVAAFSASWKMTKEHALSESNRKIHSVKV